MARRTAEQDMKEESTTELQEASPRVQSDAALTGTTEGAIIPSAKNTVGGSDIGPDPGMTLQVPDDFKPVKVTRYRVTNPAPAGKPGYPVLQGGVTVFLQQGKVVDSTSYDIAYLRAQNVKLEEIV